MVNYYELFNVDNDADPNVIKAAYHNAILKLHPDVNTRFDANDKTVILTLAYAQLSDKNLRKLYDKQIGISYPNDYYNNLFNLILVDMNPLLIFFKVINKNLI